MENSPLSQQINDELVSIVRQDGDLSKGLDVALSKLVLGLEVDRGLILQIIGDQFGVTHDHSSEGQVKSLVGTYIDTMASTRVVLNFVSIYPDSASEGVIMIQSDSEDPADWEPLFELLKGFVSHLLVQLRSDIFSGFMALQSKKPRQWSREEISTISKISALMSVLIRDQFDLKKLEQDALVNRSLAKISSMFLAHKRGPANDVVRKSVAEIASLMNFAQSRVYVYSEEGVLIQIGAKDESLKLDADEDVFVQAFKSGRGRLIDPKFTEKVDYEQFDGKSALILPLVNKERGTRIGVFAVWDRPSDMPFRAQDREVGLTMAGELSDNIAISECVFET
jgi:hypothetical protein